MNMMGFLPQCRSTIRRILAPSSTKYPNKKTFSSSCSSSSLEYTNSNTMAPALPPTHPRPLPSTPTTSSQILLPVSNSRFLPLRYIEGKVVVIREPTTVPSSGDPCVDFFFYVVRGSPLVNARVLLLRAWAHDPLTTLKLICQLRRVGRTGKSDKEGFYQAAFWLHENHPKTLALNLRCFAEFGCMKDLPEILFRQVAGADARQRIRNRERFPRNKWKLQSQRLKMNILQAAEDLSKYRKIDMARRVVERYNSDSNYRFLHDNISDFFAESLKSDIGFLNAGEFEKISLAAKWCPSLDSSFDRSTLLCESIAKRVFPRESDPSYAEIKEAHYAYRVRDRLRKEILVPLRKFLKLPEIYMSSNRWDELPYERVGSVAMKKYKKLFEKHDFYRIRNFSSQVRIWKAILAARALLPHEIISFQHDEMFPHRDIDKVTDLQWKRMVEVFSKKWKLRDIIPVCHVGDVLYVQQRRVSKALGLLTSELSEEPWRGHIISFSEDPQLRRIEGDKLRDKLARMSSVLHGFNIDFQKLFDRILDFAVAAKLEEKKMVKRVFVFTHWDLDKTSKNSWETDYTAIQRKYKEKGYGSSIPEIVYWNFSDTSATVIPRREKGLVLIGGFSNNLLKVFLDNGGEVNPEEVMVAAVAGEEYQRVRVFD